MADQQSNQPSPENAAGSRDGGTNPPQPDPGTKGAYPVTVPKSK